MAVDALTLYLGTYTSPEGSRGIYRCRLDTATGRLTPPELVAEGSNPSFLAMHPSGRYLYAVHEEFEGSISAYSVATDGALTRLNEVPTHGAHPCHVSVDPFARNALVANYSSGTAACLPIRVDGSLEGASWTFQNTGKGPNQGRQEGPHMHAIVADARSRHAYACDLGTDEVLVLRFDTEKGSLELAEPRSVKVTAGGGPRHIALHPSGRFAFVNHEMGNAATSFSVDAMSGGLTPLNTVPTVPSDWKGGGTAEVVVHPNGRWLYVSNRGHDSIAVLSIDDEGHLSPHAFVATGSKEPRGMEIDPTGRWLVVAGQKSDDLTVLSVDPQSGAVQPTSTQTGISKPVCVVFARPGMH